MSGRKALEGLLARVRRRALFDTLARWLPLPLAVAALAWRAAGVAAAVATGVLGFALVLVLALRESRRFGRAWLISRLDSARRDLDDSSGLLFLREEALSPLQRLQRGRLEQRLRERPAPDLRARWSARAILAAWLLLLAACVVVALWPATSPPASRTPMVEGATTGRATPQLVAQALWVRPPAYTGQPAATQQSLDAEAAAGSVLRWRLRYAPQPDGVELVFHDGRRIALQPEDGEWTASLVLEASTLYRVVPAGVAGAEQSALHRLDAVPDLPPRVRVLAPERGLTLLAPGQDAWLLQFEALDDHGVAPRARLLLTRTEGTGENIGFHEHVRVLQGRGDPRGRRFELRLRPSEFGLQRGEDLVARLEVLDNRAPQPQLARSASVILRWPPEPALGAEGLDGLARQILPAYFRSQRQIIIDAEALLEAKPRLAGDEFERRSDLLGVDQRLLRLRYGQFLGEESEGARTLPTSDLPTSDLPTSDLPTSNESTGDAPPAGADAHDGHDAHEQQHDHDHAGPGTPAPAGFGNVGNVLEEFGHTHDIAEAATLLDPETRETLRKALREMWQSELHLRQAAPDQALPYANRALELIKQVQQAERIYLQRVGTQLPPIDETRRLTGDRDGLRNRPLPPLPAAGGDAVLAGAWQSLHGAAASAPPATLDALQEWTEANRERLEDPLAWIAAIDALRQDPGCADCRDTLRGLVWSALPRPAGAFGRRDGGATGQRYLEALHPARDTP